MDNNSLTLCFTFYIHIQYVWHVFFVPCTVIITRNQKCNLILIDYACSIMEKERERMRQRLIN